MAKGSRASPLVPTVAELRQRWYPNTGSPFEALVDSALSQARRVLVFGAGRGVFERDLRASARLVIGIDVTSAIKDNPYLDGAVLYNGISLPIDTATFDLCVARWVIEHIAEPESVLNEIARVVRPGGRFVFITMNAWFYAGLLARIVPNRLHAPIIKWAMGRESRDTFPTYYRANTRRRLGRLLHEAGFKAEMLRVESGDPAYLQFSRLTYVLGTLFHKVVNRVPRLEDLGQAVIGSFVKQ